MLEVNKDSLAVIYERVSSDKQQKEGISLDAQDSKAKKYCEERKFKLVEIYRDEAKSAGTIRKRPEFKRLLKDAKLKKFKVIIITKFDRAFRNASEAILTLDSLHAQGIDLVSIDENIDTTTTMGRAMFQMISIFAELERNLTSDRVNSINRYRFDKGLIVGKAPLGYKWSKQKKKYIIDEKEGEKVKDIFNLALQGIRWKDICKKHKISTQTYYNILRNKVYIGLIGFNGEECVGNHEQLIDKETFDNVQKN